MTPLSQTSPCPNPPGKLPSVIPQSIWAMSPLPPAFALSKRSRIRRVTHSESIRGCLRGRSQCSTCCLFRLLRPCLRLPRSPCIQEHAEQSIVLPHVMMQRAISSGGHLMPPYHPNQSQSSRGGSGHSTSAEHFPEDCGGVAALPALRIPGGTAFIVRESAPNRKMGRFASPPDYDQQETTVKDLPHLPTLCEELLIAGTASKLLRYQRDRIVQSWSWFFPDYLRLQQELHDTKAEAMYLVQKLAKMEAASESTVTNQEASWISFPW